LRTSSRFNRTLSNLAAADVDIALSSDLRAAALMNLGTVETWSLARQDAERHLKEGAVLAREISRPYLEVGCLAQLGSVSEPHSFGTARRQCHEAIALAERHGWGAEPVIAPALVTLADTMTGGASLTKASDGCSAPRGLWKRTTDQASGFGCI
jgi:hypothetical protein